VVLDRCATPLESCRRLAQAWRLPIATWQEDLMDLAAQDRFDIVLVHGTLHYIPADRRQDVLARLRRALRPDGRLVLLFNVSEALAGSLASEGRSRYADWVIEELTRLRVPLPEPRNAFAERLRVHAENREHREGAFRGPEMVQNLLAGAGFAVIDQFEIGLALADPMQHFVSRMAKRRFLVVAEARRDAAPESGARR
jgi:SAM-dependent methyltransferase